MEGFGTPKPYRQNPRWGNYLAANSCQFHKKKEGWLKGQNQDLKGGEPGTMENNSQEVVGKILSQNIEVSAILFFRISIGHWLLCASFTLFVYGRIYSGDVVSIIPLIVGHVHRPSGQEGCTWGTVKSHWTWIWFIWQDLELWFIWQDAVMRWVFWGPLEVVNVFACLRNMAHFAG